MTTTRDVAHLKELYDRGLTLRQIAERVGMTHQAVHQKLVRAGIELRPRGGNTGGHSRHRK